MHVKVAQTSFVCEVAPCKRQPNIYLSSTHILSKYLLKTPYSSVSASALSQHATLVVNRAA